MPTFHFDLVSPEKLVFSGEVDQVDIPGAAGDFGVLAGHAPLLAMIKPGILVILGQGGPQRIVVGGGFADVNHQGLTVLADLAVPVDQFDRTKLESDIRDAQDDVADAKDESSRDKLREKLEQLQALRTVLG
jgi:F-type H+-transporting ATPase subunit epsilon